MQQDGGLVVRAMVFVMTFGAAACAQQDPPEAALDEAAAALQGGAAQLPDLVVCEKLLSIQYSRARILTAECSLCGGSGRVEPAACCDLMFSAVRGVGSLADAGCLRFPQVELGIQSIYAEISQCGSGCYPCEVAADSCEICNIAGYGGCSEDDGWGGAPIVCCGLL